MTDIVGERSMIQVQEAAAQAAISEATTNRVGAAINFINTKQLMKFQFGIKKAQATSGNPTYNIGLTLPYLGMGDPETHPYAYEIVGIIARHGEIGSGGTSELDLKWAAAGSSSYATIFSTKPAVDSSADDDSECDTFGLAATPTGWTAPVLSKTLFAAGDKLRCDLTQVMTGTPNGFILDVYLRPANA